MQELDRRRWASALAVALAAIAGACATRGASFDPSAATTTARGCPAPRSSAAPSETTMGTHVGRAEERGDAVGDPRVALRQICAMMARSADAWNRGDLDAFVADYLDGDRTTYIGSRGIVRGRAAVREVYAPRFAAGAVRDSLSFERVEVDLLAPDLVNTIAWYVLARGDSVTARGPTSLVMRRVGGRWMIVHDHSS